MKIKLFKNDTVESHTSTIPVTVLDQYGQHFPGSAEVVLLSQKSAFNKGAKRAAKLIGAGILGILPFGFLEPFLFMFWGTAVVLILVIGVGPYLHLKFASELRSFTSVHSKCPYCQSQEPLQPYLSTSFEQEFTVICPSCGQTARVIQTSVEQTLVE
jgi:Zn ribbon nucleic-acid-binding protein